MKYRMSAIISTFKSLILNKGMLGVDVPFKQRLLIFIGGLLSDSIKLGNITIVEDDENLIVGENGFIFNGVALLVVDGKWTIKNW